MESAGAPNCGLSQDPPDIEVCSALTLFTNALCFSFSSFATALSQTHSLTNSHTQFRKFCGKSEENRSFWRSISIFEAVAAGSLVSVLLSCRAAESARPESASAAVRARRVHVADAHREEALEAQRRQKLFSMCTVQ